MLGVGGDLFGVHGFVRARTALFVRAQTTGRPVEGVPADREPAVRGKGGTAVALTYETENMMIRPGLSTWRVIGGLAALLPCSVAHAAPLPDRVWGTYFGGTGPDWIRAVARDGAGDVYVCGEALSLGLGTRGVHQSEKAGSLDVTLVRFTPAGERVWATYLGGSLSDKCIDVKVDSAGDIVVVGSAASDDGIASPNSLQPISPVQSGVMDGFAAKFDAGGKRLWGTYLGGSGIDVATGVAFDADDNLYIVGEVASALDFMLPGGVHPTPADDGDFTNTYLVKLTPGGDLVWGTYYGGSENDEKPCVAVGADAVYLAGYTRSSDAIATDGALDTTKNGDEDGFIARFNLAGGLDWATYYGGVGDDRINSIAVAPDGGFALFGTTDSAGLATPGVHQTAIAGALDDVVARFDETGAPMWATYVGGPGVEFFSRGAVDPFGNLYLAGETDSSTGIATPGAFQTEAVPGDNVYLVKLGPAGTLRYGTYLGGNKGSKGGYVAHFAADAIYLAGTTTSSAGIATANVVQPNPTGGNDGFLVRLTEQCSIDAECSPGFCVEGGCCDDPCLEGTCDGGTCVPNAEETGTTSEDSTGDTGETTGGIDTGETGGSSSTGTTDVVDTGETGGSASTGTSSSGSTATSESTSVDPTAPEETTGGDPSAPTDATPTGSGTGEPMPATSSAHSEATTTDSSSTGGETNEGGGCSCKADPGSPQIVLAGLSLLAWRRRGRRVA